MEIICEHTKRKPMKDAETVRTYARQPDGRWIETRHVTRTGRRLRPQVGEVMNGDEPAGISVAAYRWIGAHGENADRAAVTGYRERPVLRCRTCGENVPVRDFSDLAHILDRVEAAGAETLTLPALRMALTYQK